MAQGDTSYVETELLLAVMEDRIGDAQKIASRMLINEQVALIEHLEYAADILLKTDPTEL